MNFLLFAYVSITGLATQAPMKYQYAHVGAAGLNQATSAAAVRASVDGSPSTALTPGTVTRAPSLTACLMVLT